MKGLPVIALLAILLSACGPQQNPATAPNPAEQSNAESIESAAQIEWLETGDLGAIRERGVLRILTHLGEGYHLPRSDYPVSMGRQWLKRFAKQQGLRVQVVAVETFTDLIPALLEGRGDVIANNFTALAERKTQVLFTRPLDRTRAYLVAPVATPVSAESGLSGMTLAVRRGTSFEQPAANLSTQYDDLSIEYVDDHLSNEDILDRLVEGAFDLAIADGNYLKTAAHYRKDFKAVFPVSVSRDIAWAVRPNATTLLSELNRFISTGKLASPGELRSQGDLDQILQRRVLRVAMHNTMASYFLWRGELYGFEYELAKHFADERQLHLEVLVADNHHELMDLLRRGKADIAAAFLTPTLWRETINIAFSKPYHYASEVLVSRPDAPIESLDTINNRAIVVRRSSSYWQTLQDLVPRGHILNIVPAGENLDTEQLIDQVGRGEIDLTVSDSHILSLELTWRDDVNAALSLTGPRPQSWAVRENNPQLLQAVNEFLTREYQSEFYQETYHRYFQASHTAPRLEQQGALMQESGAISPYDDLIQRYAQQYGFDWLLLAAQVYQESRFDPAATSWSGATGLMQVLPQTARSLGLLDIQNVETGLHAGVKYLAWLYQQFDPGLAEEDRMWFSLASYNAGIGHLRDARTLARRLGKNPDQWFGEVEAAMILLSRQKYARGARHGYVRGMEPVQYVLNIRQHYQTFSELQLPQRTTQASAP